MNFLMARSFDHAGYYETRLILATAALAFALWAWRARAEPRFLVAFASGALFQGAMEFLIAQAGLRGAGYALHLFGQAVPGPWAFLLQGVVEGGPLTLMAFWFAQRMSTGGSLRQWAPYVAALTGICALSLVVTAGAAGQPVTSVRPIFRWDWFWFGLMAGSILLTLMVRGVQGVRRLALFAAGVVVYLVVTYEPMHVAGVRQIVEQVGGEPRPAALWPQIWVMAYSHVIEVTGSKLHYFAGPLLLGLFDPPRASRLPAQA